MSRADRAEPVIQVAGIRSLDEAAMLAACGFTHLGFPLRLPDGREDLSEGEAARVISRLAGRVPCVVITYVATAGEALELCEATGAQGLQLHGAIDTVEVRRVRDERPDLFLIRSLVVAPGNFDGLLAIVHGCEAAVDAFITDTFDPATGRRGATGLTHDWIVSRRLVEATRRPVILAGGLNPANVAAAVEAVGPAGVDVHTGVEGPDGAKDPVLAATFASNARAALRRNPYNDDDKPTG